MLSPIKRQIYILFILIFMCKLYNTLVTMNLAIKSVPASGKTHSATVIFFHGSGDTGNNLLEWVRFLLGNDLQFPHIKVLYPTAPVQPYTPLRGEPSNVWFDRKAVTIDALENRRSLSAIYKTVSNLINSEIELGIPSNRIIVGGFSMGGALALHTAYHIVPNLGGVFACSSFLNNDSIVYDSLSNRNDNHLNNTILPELLMFHGNRDSLVFSEWGQITFNRLRENGVSGEFVLLKNTMHELKQREMVQIKSWIEEKLPPLESDLTNKL